MAAKRIQQIAEYILTGCESVTSHCANRNPHYSFPPNRRGIGLHKFFAELLRLSHAAAGEPERFIVAQTTLLEAGDGVAQVRFQFAPDFRREAGLCGQFLPPIFNGGAQIETGFIFHNLPRVL